MNALLNNDCVEQVQLDNEGGNCEGWIYFQGQIIYTGEINNNLPHGFGTLKLQDGSTFQGNFEKGKFLDGTFKHYSGIIFEGQFQKDKFSKGKIIFCDGDYLLAEFGLRRNKWILKKGSFFKDDGILIGKLDEKNKSLTSKLKTVECCDQQIGAYIEFQYFYNNYGQPWMPFRISGDLSTFTQIEKEAQIIKNYSNIDSVIYNKEDIYENDVLISEKYQFLLEYQINVQKQILEKNWILNFQNIYNIYFVGDFNFAKQKFQFKGNMYIDRTKTEIVEIQTFLFGKISIKYQQKNFNSLKEFILDISTIYTKITIQQQQRKRNTSLYNKNAVNSIIEDIKTEEDCKIF